MIFLMCAMLFFQLVHIFSYEYVSMIYYMKFVICHGPRKMNFLVPNILSNCIIILRLGTTTGSILNFKCIAQIFSVLYRKYNDANS